MKSRLIIFFLALSVFVFTGCSIKKVWARTTTVIDTFNDDSLESNLNRVAISSGILKLNNTILYKMPISSDVKWIENIHDEANISVALREKIKKQIDARLKKDPYYGTLKYTRSSGLFTGIKNYSIYDNLTALEKDFFTKLYFLYYKGHSINSNNPNYYAFSLNLKDYTELNGATPLINVRAIRGKRYKNFKEAVYSFFSRNDRKKIAELENNLEKISKKLAKIDVDIKKIDMEINKAKSDTLKKRLEEKKEKLEITKDNIEKENEKMEEAFNIVWEKAVDNIGQGIDEEKIALAKKLDKIIDIIYSNSLDAATILTSAFGKSYKIIQEKKVFTIIAEENSKFRMAKLRAHRRGRNLLSKRAERFGKNALVSLPVIAINLFLIGKQIFYIKKYNKAIKKVLEIAEARNSKNKFETKKKSIKNQKEI